jgi:hypothetical protein
MESYPSRGEYTAPLAEDREREAKDAARWRMLPAFFAEYQINALKLFRDIDAALQQHKREGE